MGLYYRGGDILRWKLLLGEWILWDFYSRRLQEYFVYFQNRIGKKSPKFTAKERLPMGLYYRKQKPQPENRLRFFCKKKESDHASYAGIIRFRLKGSENNFHLSASVVDYTEFAPLLIFVMQFSTML